MAGKDSLPGNYANIRWSTDHSSLIIDTALSKHSGYNKIGKGQNYKKGQLYKGLKSLGIKRMAATPQSSKPVKYDAKLNTFPNGTATLVIYVSQAEVSAFETRTKGKRAKEKKASVALSYPQPSRKWKAGTGREILRQINEWIRDTQKQGHDVTVMVNEDNKVSVDVTVKRNVSL
jgi:hypothetical protein